MLFEEKRAIISGYNRITQTITQFKTIIEHIKTNRDAIQLIVDNYKTDGGPEIHNEVEALLNMDSELSELSHMYSNAPKVSEDINNNYREFLLSEISSFNLNKYGLSNLDYMVDSFLETIREMDCSKPITIHNMTIINFLTSVPQNIVSCVHDLNSIYSTICIFDQIKDINGNIVMVGANGSGKSTFARQLRGKISDNIVILSAQHLLYCSQMHSIPATGNEIEEVRNFQYRDKLSSDGDFTGLINSDMDNLIKALMSEHTDCTFDAYDGSNKKVSYLKKTTDLWHSVIEHRTIKIERTGLTIELPDGKTHYSFNELSDGEKAVFYYIGHILLAQKNSYIIVDEPENHLHVAICNKLWDRLEHERTDCKFIYLSHNLNFATTRTNCAILWNKQFIPPSTWDFQTLPKDDIIPEVLVMELVGSRKNICFCEGNDKSSLDYQLYSILFPEYTVVPVSGHRDVIDYVMAYNKNQDFSTSAIGIIDGDCHLQEQIDKWKENKIFTLNANEIENLLCDKKILEAFVDRHGYENGEMDKFYKAFWRELEQDKEYQAVWYVNNYINNQFKRNFLHEKKDISKLTKELQSKISTGEIEKLYEDRLGIIESLLTKKDYEEAIPVVNFKGRLTKNIACKTIIDNYDKRVLHLIRNEKSLQEHIILKYIPDMNK